ncbi:MAG: EAL domain-containing protein [Gallionella sp.]|nr:EAL domain-containing protein [Gallionella sp.]
MPDIKPSALNNQTAIQSVQTRQMFAASPMSLFTSTLLAAILAVMQRDAVEQILVVAWFSLIALVMVARAALVMAYQRAPLKEDRNIHVWLTRFRLGVLAAGLVWGSAGFLLFPAHHPQHQMFLIFMLAGLTAGGVVSYSADLLSGILFSVLVTAPLIVRLLVAGDNLSVAMSMAALLYLGFMLMSLRHINQNLCENIALRLEATARESAIRTSEERYRLLLSHSPVGIFHYDTRLVITYCNERFAEILHTSIERIIGLDINLLKDQSVLPALRRALAGEIGYYEGHYSATLSDASGSIAMTCAPSRDDSGKITGGIAIVEDITARKQIEESLEENREKFRALSEAAFEAIFISEKGVCLEQNSRAQEMFGYTSTEAIGKSGTEWIAPEDRELVMKNMLSGYELPYETTALRKDGSTFPASIRGRMMHYKGKAVRVTSLRDISLQKQAENDLRIAATAFESREGMLITDADSTILRVNSTFTQITGYTPEEVIGKNPRLLNSGLQTAGFYAAMWGEINQSGSWEGEIWNRRKNGEIYPEHLTITAVKDKNDNITNYVASLSDITVRKAAADEIQNLAYYDPLTLLPNRRLLMDRLNQALASSTRNGRQGALLFIDLDNFKILNDTLGHNIGDLLLQQVASRLTSCVRVGDTVARLGGDEFVVMLEDLNEQALDAAAQTEIVGEKILDTLNRPYQLASYICHSSPSIGATLFNNHERTLEDLMKQADIAMYQAKKAGRNTLRFFDPVMQDTINARATLESELHKALEHQQFQLHYQIQVDSANRPLGAEALIRWFHPERGMVSPAQFIPLAEETGLILPIGLWVLETACAQLKTWGQDVFTRDLVLAVNVSARQFRQADFVTQMRAALQRHAINPERLKLELTESLLLENIEETIAKMNALNKIGIQFSLDDFGTGYSSLQYLKRLPLNQLKIDRSFVRDIANDSSDKAIVRTIIAMAHSLNLNIIAEGVETEEQRQLLFDKGCTHFQGYLFSRPISIAQFELFLTAQSC